ncbi:MAG: DUF3098 domain-containing protein [Bacteroidales bacterium]|nr:DUF3098 domain-containing protein [Candidatus Cryptobacteroides equifaecalis]
MTPKGVKLMLAGVGVMLVGFVLLAGGQSSDPQVFSYDIFDFRRLVAAPLVIVSGIILIVVSIMGKIKEK